MPVHAQSSSDGASGVYMGDGQKRGKSVSLSVSVPEHRDLGGGLVVRVGDREKQRRLASTTLPALRHGYLGDVSSPAHQNQPTNATPASGTEELDESIFLTPRCLREGCRCKASV